MNESARQTIETIANHPKVSVAIVAASQANYRWMDYAEPYMEFVTNILGIAVLSILLIKHTVDVYKSLFSKDK